MEKHWDLKNKTRAVLLDLQAEQFRIDGAIQYKYSSTGRTV